MGLAGSFGLKLPSQLLPPPPVGQGWRLQSEDSTMTCAHSFFLLRQVLYSDSFRKQIQGKAAYVLDTPEMRRVRETQRHISTVSQELSGLVGQPVGIWGKGNDPPSCFHKTNS